MKSFIINRVINENVLLLINSQKVSPMTVLNDFTIRNLNLFENLQTVVDNGKHFEHRGEADS